MKSKVKLSAKGKIPSPFGATAHKTEQTGVAVLMHWMRDIIHDKSLDLGMPDVETTGHDKKKPDMVIYESLKSQKVLCVIEAKPPYYDVFNEEELKEPARQKATRREAKYFALTNFKRLIWFNTEKVNALKPEEEQVVDKYSLSEIETLDDIEQTKYAEPMKKGLSSFLTKLYAVHTGKEAEPKQAVDEFLILRLQEKIRVLATYYRQIIEDKCHKEPAFAKKLKNWFLEQRWSFAWQPQDFDRAARQTAYLLVNKVLFYDLLQAKRPHELDPLEIPAALTKGAVLQKNLQAYFDQALKIDYETIYTTDFIDTTAFPDSKEVVEEIRELVNVLRKYDFSKLGYDVIGRIFERLIPPHERHNLGQYFTSPDVVDLILGFCSHHEGDKVLDPACGAGTFLVRAYQQKRLMNQSLKHEDILATLWGDDIAKFPAHLATINLAINDLGVDKNYPNIMQEDFFRLLVGVDGFDPEKWRKARAKTLGLEEKAITYPRWFDAVVGNPPFTRQEEIGEISPEDAEYKQELIRKALQDLKGKKMADIGKRAGIHAYFFVHGTKFLENGGYFGFVVSNSWLDVDYGKGLQEFFLKNYGIIAIIESKVERWFEQADVNTCLVILQKRRDKKERDGNLARFVYLKKPLRDFIPPAQDMWAKQVERRDAIDKLKKTILFHNDLYENDDLRVFPMSQRELWEEGFDSEKKKYVGAKWGKYLRAPDIFFKILEKGQGKLVPLREVAEVRRGFTTGANKFFYLQPTGKPAAKGLVHVRNDVGWEGYIEERFLEPILRRPKECESIRVEPAGFRFRVFLCHEEKAALQKTFALQYIRWGEERGLDKQPTCRSRPRWYDVGKHGLTSIAGKMTTKYRHYFPGSPHPFLVDNRFYEVRPSVANVHAEPLLLSLNSALTALCLEVAGRTYGGGGGPLDIKVYELKAILLVDPRLISAEGSVWGSDIMKRPVLHFWKETERQDRRALDRLVMGEVLGLTDEEQLEVYEAVTDLVKSRLQKARSFVVHKKTSDGIDVEALKNVVLESLKKEEEQ